VDGETEMDNGKEISLLASPWQPRRIIAGTKKER
jgi:hypothetical protein